MRLSLLLLLKICLLLISGCEERSVSSTDTDIDEIPGYELVWNDEFDQNSLDESSWEYMNGNGSEYGLDGWGNNELQYYTNNSRNIKVEDGLLVITALNEKLGNNNYTSARIRTKGLVDRKFGIIEARMKLPKGQGIWPAFWMLPTENVYGGWPSSGEIDIMELVGHEPDVVHGTVHYGQRYPNNSKTGRPYRIEQGDFSDDFHVFRIVWEENVIRWFVDETLYYSITPSTLSPENWPFNEDFHLLLNVAVGGDWPGNPDETTSFPQKLQVDYVRWYQSSN
ncbi:family 16 glycosylhydrolase [Balneola sp. MJW-20]|uniref:glycoside hydrolase family 16 protein n=1 Tax=Gracilimonas aurantiaca TaxID=3234185 RepID=UPI003467ECEE